MTYDPENRGNRIDSHALWSEGKDSFKSDPPNAVASLLERKTLKQIVVELQDLVLTGDDLATVKVQQVEMPAKAADVSVFIDIIGRPTTPLSFAGVAGHIGTVDTDEVQRARWRSRES